MPHSVSWTLKGVPGDPANSDGVSMDHFHDEVVRVLFLFEQASLEL